MQPAPAPPPSPPPQDSTTEVILPRPRGKHSVLDLEENGLYVLLSEQSLQYHWHWGLYLHQKATDGLAFHITRSSAADPWAYEGRPTSNVVFSVTVTAALQVAVVPPDMHGALRDRIARVAMRATPRFRTLTCRTWLLQALLELDSEGYIALKPGTTVEEIEEEARNLAMENVSKMQVGMELGSKEKVKRSVHSVA